jgi:hypothetical protein
MKLTVDLHLLCMPDGRPEFVLRLTTPSGVEIYPFMRSAPMPGWSPGDRALISNTVEVPCD